jgi:ADP-ribose pyrophosphatase YjhB (NUDIX family)
MATPRVSAGALFTDNSGRVLMLRTTYKDYWDIPGGYVEPGESPRAACIREIREELSLTIEPGPLLVIDWAPADDEGDKILYIFDGGPLTDNDVTAMVFEDGEIGEARLVDLDELGELTLPRLVRRLSTAVAAKRERRTAYAEHGREPQEPRRSGP